MTSPKVRDDLEIVELDHEAVVYDPLSGQLHHLNPAATIVFGLLDGSTNTEAITSDIADALEVSPAAVASDVSSVVSFLEDAGLFERSDAADG